MVVTFCSLGGAVSPDSGCGSVLSYMYVLEWQCNVRRGCSKRRELNISKDESPFHDTFIEDDFTERELCSAYATVCTCMLGFYWLTVIHVYRKSLNKSRGVYFLSKVFKKASI